MSTQTQRPQPAAKPGGGNPVTRVFNTLAGALPTWAWALIWLLVAILYGWFGQEQIDIAFIDRDFYGPFVETMAFVMMALGLNIVVGFAGLLDLGYVAFYAIGAFVIGWLASGHFSPGDGWLTDLLDKIGMIKDVGAGESAVRLLAAPLPENAIEGAGAGIHVNFFAIIFIAAAFTALWGAILGAPTLRLRGDYLAIVTLAFGEIVPRFFELSQSGPFGIGNLNLSNGTRGITPVDNPYFPVILEDVGRIDLRPYYYIALAMTLFIVFINYTLRDSRLGRAWIAVREDEVAAAAMGVPLVRVKLWAYAIGAAIGGFAGAFLGAANNTVNVSQFEFSFSVFILCMVIIGGMGNIAGVIVGAVALNLINKFLLPELNGVPDSLGLDFDVTAVTGGIFGFLLITMMILRPQGFIPNRRRKLELTGEAEEGPVFAEGAVR